MSAIPGLLEREEKSTVALAKTPGMRNRVSHTGVSRTGTVHRSSGDGPLHGVSR
jgi:hypothetical protein